MAYFNDFEKPEWLKERKRLYYYLIEKSKRSEREKIIKYLKEKEITGNESIGQDGFKKGYNQAINDIKKIINE